MSINRVTLTGNLTRDPELRALPSGTQVLNLGVAVNDRRRNQQTGEWEDYPNYIDCVMFGTRGESVSRFLSKGSKVAIEGKLRWRQWQDRNTGQNRSKIEVVVDDIEFMSSRNGDGRAQGGYQSQPAPQAQPYGVSAPPQQSYAPQAQPQTAAVPSQPAAPSPQPTPPSAEVFDEDIPF